MVENKKEDEAKAEKAEPVEEKSNDKPDEAKVEKSEDSVAEESKADEKEKAEPKEKTEGDDSITETKVDEIEPVLTNEFKIPASGTVKPLHHHSTKRLLIIAAVVLVLALFAGLAIWMSHDDPVSTESAEIVYSQGAVITSVEGDVEYNSGTDWVTVEPGTDLSEGDGVRTLKASRAIITLDDGSAIRLNENTIVTLTKIETNEVAIDNEGGEVYTRVSASETRKFYVYVDDQPYLALGTAYKTMKTEDVNGVEVYHSKVKTADSEEVEKDVAEGEAFYAKSKNKDQVDKITKLDLEKLKDDEFLKWNKAKDEDEKEFADKLGFLKDIDQPKKEEEPEEPAPVVTPNGITASGARVTDGIKVSWSVKGIDTSGGFKVAYSKDDTTPSYGENSAKYVSPGESSAVLGLTDGKVWHARVCAYRGDGICESYSNTVSVTAPTVATYQVDSGTVTITTANSDGLVSWTITETSPYGYKVAYSESVNPVYPSDGNDEFVYVDKEGTKTTTIPSDKLTPGITYYVRVCKYNKYADTSKGEKYCNIYSGEKSFIAQ